MGKYTPLEKFLHNNARKKIEFSFQKIEEIISAPLPKSARVHREWWSNERGGSHVQANAWLEAGWQVVGVDLEKESVLLINLKPFNYKQRLKDFDQRWEISTSIEPDYEAFRNRILNFGANVFSHNQIRKGYFEDKYKGLIGLPFNPPDSLLEDLNIGLESPRSFGIIGKHLLSFRLTDYQGFVNLLKAINIIFWLMEEHYVPEFDALGDILFEAVERAINLTPNINVDIMFDGEKIIFIPSGAKELDQKLINENLIWLNQYSRAKDSFEKALSLLLEKEPSKQPEILDNLRKSVEFILQDLFVNKRTLENNLKELGKWLKDKGVNPEIRNIFIKSLDYFTKYQNVHVKHGDSYNPKELEYLIYQTGLFLRLIQTLSRKND